MLSSLLQIKDNFLTIDSAQVDVHPGMYQCAAINFHGTSLSSAQIRVLCKYVEPKESMEGQIQIALPCLFRNIFGFHSSNNL